MRLETEAVDFNWSQNFGFLYNVQVGEKRTLKPLQSRLDPKKEIEFWEKTKRENIFGKAVTKDS